MVPPLGSDSMAHCQYHCPRSRTHAARRVPIGVIGALWLGGAGRARGISIWAALTAERFVPYPSPRSTVSNGRPVDSRPDGALEFVGRIYYQVSCARPHPARDLAAAVSRPEDVAQAVVLGARTTPASSATWSPQRLSAPMLRRPMI